MTPCFAVKTKVGHDLTSPPCCSTPSEIGVVNFDGTQKKPLVTDFGLIHPFYPGTGDPLQISADGSRLLLGPGVLFNTATGELLQLAARGNVIRLLLQLPSSRPTLEYPADDQSKQRHY